MVSPIKIMIVEDQKLTRVGIKALFNGNSNYTVIKETDNGKEAVEFADIYKHDVILMDIGLPDIYGI